MGSYLPSHGNIGRRLEVNGDVTPFHDGHSVYFKGVWLAWQTGGQLKYTMTHNLGACIQLDIDQLQP